MMTKVFPQATKRHTFIAKLTSRVVCQVRTPRTSPLEGGVHGGRGKVWVTLLDVRVKCRFRREDLIAAFDTLKCRVMCLEFVRIPRIAGIIQPIGSWTVFECTAVRVEIVIHMTSRKVRYALIYSR